MLPGQNVSEAKFIECFSCQNKKEDIEEENLLSGIENSATSFKKAQPIKKLIIEGESGLKDKTSKAQQFDQDNSSNSIIYKKTNNFFEKPEPYSPSFR